MHSSNRRGKPGTQVRWPARIPTTCSSLQVLANPTLECTLFTDRLRRPVHSWHTIRVSRPSLRQASKQVCRKLLPISLMYRPIWRALCTRQTRRRSADTITQSLWLVGLALLQLLRTSTSLVHLPSTHRWRTWVCNCCLGKCLIWWRSLTILK